MSPSEFDLRAALRDGEGDGVDADRVISSALRLKVRRHDLRVRTLAVAAVVVVVAGGGVGLAELRGSNSNSGSSSSAFSKDAPSEAAGAGAGAPQVNDGVQGGGNSSAGSAARSASQGCPATPVTYSLPGGGGTNQFGADGPLFGKPVASILICTYSASRSGGTGSELSGAAASALASEVESSTAPGGPSNCDTAVSAELLATASDGAELQAVWVHGTCGRVELTNGTAIRYADGGLFSDAGVSLVPGSVTPGKASGSPKR